MRQGLRALPWRVTTTNWAPAVGLMATRADSSRMESIRSALTTLRPNAAGSSSSGRSAAVAVARPNARNDAETKLRIVWAFLKAERRVEVFIGARYLARTLV